MLRQSNAARAKEGEEKKPETGLAGRIDKICGLEAVKNEVDLEDSGMGLTG